jgi:hypothetical protein
MQVAEVEEHKQTFMQILEEQVDLVEVEQVQKHHL